jgi:DNA-binding PadR family transcriptional regulator
MTSRRTDNTQDPALTSLGRYAGPATLILASLAGGAKHGYAMVDDIHRLAGVQLGPGTLYGAIARLERLGLIRPLPAEARRRPYQLTQAGSAALRTELETLARLSSAGLVRLGALA